MTGTLFAAALQIEAGLTVLGVIRYSGRGPLAQTTAAAGDATSDAIPDD